MVFSNLLFIFLFLPLNLIFYFIARDIRTKNAVLLIFSLLFYAWGEPKYVFLLVFMALADYLFALAVGKNREAHTKRAKAAMIGAVIVNIGLIGVFKYGAFVCLNTNSLFGFPDKIPQIALPIGISFYTFQLLTYVIDVYRGDAPAQKNFANVLLYASLFHQCIAGPIVRYKDINDEIVMRSTDINEFGKGIQRFAIGLGKKALLANVCGNLCDEFLIKDSVANDFSVLSETLSTISSRPALALWIGMAFYMLQIYLDFSAYSDMAIGMGQMIGFHYKENFDYPYMSGSVTEFWRRWHISLGTFFRDYVYIPLGGNRKGKVRQIFNMLIVWGLTGLWHGASWNYVLWGLYFFVFLTIEKLFFKKALDKMPRIISSLYLLTVVFFGWILFRFHSLEVVLGVIKGMFCLNGNSFADFETTAMLKNNVFFLIIASLSVFPIAKKISENAEKERRFEIIQNAGRIIIPSLLLILATLSLVGDSYNPFLYFQF